MYARGAVVRGDARWVWWPHLSLHCHLRPRPVPLSLAWLFFLCPQVSSCRPRVCEECPPAFDLSVRGVYPGFRGHKSGEPRPATCGLYPAPRRTGPSHIHSHAFRGPLADGGAWHRMTCMAFLVWAAWGLVVACKDAGRAEGVR